MAKSSTSRQPSDARSLAAILARPALLPASALASSSFIKPFHTVSTVGSTVPANGDLNPYGIVTMPSSIGSLVRGDLLISNFNDRENRQGTGTTLVQVTRGGSPSRQPTACSCWCATARIGRGGACRVVDGSRAMASLVIRP